jgi:hypothetical protein
MFFFGLRHPDVLLVYQLKFILIDKQEDELEDIFKISIDECVGICI